MGHFNGLTPAEAERLAMLAEEAGEIIQAVGKILRHGYSSYHPDDPEGPDNRDRLQREVDDLITVSKIMVLGRDITLGKTSDITRKLRYTHHQGYNG